MNSVEEMRERLLAACSRFSVIDRETHAERVLEVVAALKAKALVVARKEAA